MHQGLVVAVLVEGAELQVAVEIQAQVVAPARDDDALPAARFRVDDLVGIELVLGEVREALGEGEAAGERGENDGASQGHRAGCPQPPPEEPDRPQRDQRVHEAEEKCRPDEAEPGRQHERKGDRDGQRADVVEREHLGDDVLQSEPLPEDSHDERDLEADEDPHEDHDRVEHHAEARARVGEGQEHDGRGEAAQYGDHQLDVDETRDEAGDDVARQVGTRAHGGEVHADHHRELRDRVAQQVGRGRGGDQLVDEPAGRDDEDRREKRAVERFRGWQRPGVRARARGALGGTGHLSRRGSPRPR